MHAELEPTIQSVCSKFVCASLLARAVRSHFFGRDSHSLLVVQQDNQSTKQTQLVLGRTVTTENRSIQEKKAYEEWPSRLQSSLAWISLLDQQDFEDLPVRTKISEILDELLPICYALIDNYNRTHAALGVSCLIHLMDITTQHKSGERSEAMVANASVWTSFADAIISVLSLAFTTTNEGSVLFLIGQAQCRLFTISGEHQKERRIASHNWLSKLQQDVHRTCSRVRLWELLAGGIIPLLNQHAQLENADGMEFGRLGLSVLLPLISGESIEVDSKTRFASLVAFVNLLMSCHPIMPRHGGKIMSSLLAGICDAPTSSDGEKATLSMMKHTAAVALVFCGESSSRAAQILDDVVSDKAKYEERLVRAVLDIRKRSTVLLLNEELK